MKKIIGIALALLISASLGVMPAFAASNDDKASQDVLKKQSSQKIVSDSPASGVDEALQRVNDEEKYIVSLISNLSKKETTTANWEYNLKYLKDNYKNIQEKAKSQNINIKHVNSYIEAYENVLAMKNTPSSRAPSAVNASGLFSYGTAVQYANDHWSKSSYNEDYPDWSSEGGDCANFISQCLYAGGMPMKGTPGTQAAAENFANWFSKGNKRVTKNVSSTWRGADAFRHYWQTNAIGYKKFDSYTTAAYDYGYIGYAVSILTSTGRAAHTLIIVDYGAGSDLIYAAHSGETHTGSLKSKVANSGSSFIIYKTW